MKKLPILFIIFFFTINIFAAQYWSEKMSGVTTPTLKKVLNKSINAYHNKNYDKAAELIDEALEMKSAREFQRENDDPELGPLCIQLIAEKAFYKSLPTPQNKCNPEVEKISLSALKEYRKIAAGKQWPAYRILYHSLINYYINKGQPRKVDEQLDKLLEYSPSEIINVLRWGLIINIPFSNAEKKINDYVKRGGDYSPELIFFKIRFKNKNGGNVFQDCIDFLNEYPTAKVEDLTLAVEFMRKSIDTKNPKQVKNYCDTINRVAFAQPNSEESLKFVSEMIDERKKVEIIFEECHAN